MKRELNVEETKLKNRNKIEKKSLINRINKIEGQVRGIKKMLESDRYCNDILIQVSAVNKSIKSLGYSILKDHLRECVVKEIINGNEDVIDEVMDLFRRLE